MFLALTTEMMELPVTETGKSKLGGDQEFSFGHGTLKVSNK